MKILREDEMSELRSTTKTAKKIIVCLMTGLWLSACATTEEQPEFVDVSPRVTEALGSVEAPFSRALAETADRAKTGAEEEDRVKIFKGTGIMVKGQQSGGAVPTTAAGARQTPSSGPSQKKLENVVLNFEAADLREVIRNILGDILGEAYLIDPAVNGQVTIRSTSGLNGDALYATLETLLRMNNATMVKEGGVYKILPAATGVKGNVTPQLGGSQRPLPKGFSVQIVPLKYVSASEMMSILEPFAKDAQAMRADDTRNLIVLSGTELELRHLMETIEMFDIDWMAGMSVGMFTLKYADVKGLGEELQTIMGTPEGALFAGGAKIIPIERLNTLMVLTPRAEYLDEIKVWIDRLDDVGMGDVPRLYVYSLKYSRADRVAPLLQQAFTGRSSATTSTQPTLAPGSTPSRVSSFNNSSTRSTGMTTGSRTGLSTSRNMAGTTTTRSGTTASTARAGTTAASRMGTATQPRAATTTRGGVVATGGAGMGIAQDIEVVADEDNNALLIVATPREYELVEQALKKLDVPQRQVMIEVTMAEVTLDENTSYGAQWWFSSGDIFGGYGAVSPLAGPAGDALTDTFNLIIKPGSSVNAIINAKGTAGNVKLVANPHIAALDNQEATIEVTDSLPVQSTYVYGSGDGSSSSWDYLRVGVMLRITPHINEGGNVSLEAEIEFSGKGSGADAAIAADRAPQTTSRLISTQMMVPSGGTMVLGGLIRDDISDGTAGVPYLSRIPVLGGLFGKQTWESKRSELVIFITPRVVSDNETRRAIIQDLRYRMDNLEGFLQKSKALPPELSEELGERPVWTRPEDDPKEQ